MSVLNKDDFFARLQAKIGEDTSEEALTFIEDVTDTFNEMESKISGDTEDWKKKYEENDNEWKKKYRDRFFTSGEQIKDEQEHNVEADGEIRDFSQLFKEREG